MKQKQYEAIYNSMKLEGQLVGQSNPDRNKPLMSAEVVADKSDFPEVNDLFWVREYRRGENPSMCYEN